MALYPYLPAQLRAPRHPGEPLLEIGLGYGTVSQRLAETGFDYHGLDIARGYRTKPSSLKALVLDAGRRAATGVSWRAGSGGRMHSRFVALRVRPANHQLRATAHAAATMLQQCWLPAEWPSDADEPTDFWLSTLPADTPLAQLVRLAKAHWRIEHDYRELKDALGLDHFEGRTYRGWHHHVTCVSVARAFLTLERRRPRTRAAA